MSAKPKFNPVITRIKLNPEQAVLACSCYSSRQAYGPYGRRGASARKSVCYENTRRTNYCNQRSSSAVS